MIADRYYPWSNSIDGNSIVKVTRPRLGPRHVYHYGRVQSESRHRAVHRVRRYSLFVVKIPWSVVNLNLWKHLVRT